MAGQRSSDAGSAEMLRQLLRSCSFELASRDPANAVKIAPRFPGGRDLFIEFLPSETYHHSVRAAGAARAAGFNPVPHIAARHLDTASQLDDFLARLAGEAGVTRVLVIAGDSEHPRGPFSTSFDLIRSGAFERHGIAEIGIAAYPEPPPKMTRSALDQALQEKIGLAAEHGLGLFIVTQFCFEAEPILAFLRDLRRRGIAMPVRVGLAGPANVTTLLKFAVRCGIGNSIRAIRTHADSIARLLGDAGPDEIVRAIAAALAQEAALGPLTLHFFPFGGLARFADWRDATLAALDGTGPGQEKELRRPA
jgi:methylenetetrahydrofolate reductase (NADPH)